MNNRNTRVNDVAVTRQIKKFRLRDWTSGITDCGMRGILMSIFTDFIALEVVFSNVTGIIFGLGSIRQVFISSGINKLNIQSQYRKIGSSINVS